MSSLTGGISAANLAGSAAGAQSRAAQADKTSAAAAEQGLQVDRGEMSARSAGDVDQADHSADRDADGRLLHESTPPPDENSDDLTDDDHASPSPRPADAYGERGTTLDLDA